MSEPRSETVAALSALYTNLYGSSYMTTFLASSPSTAPSAPSATTSVIDHNLTTALVLSSLTRPAVHTSTTTVNNIYSKTEKSEDEDKKPPSLVGPALCLLGAIPPAIYYLTSDIKLNREIKFVNELIEASPDGNLNRKWKQWLTMYQSYTSHKNYSLLGFVGTGALGLFAHLWLYGSRYQYPTNLGALALGTVSLGYFCFNYFMRNVPAEKAKLQEIMRFA